MNKFERAVYDLVKANPRLKQSIRNLYQGFFDLMPRKKEFSENPIFIKEGYFFGFHDICPFSKDNSKILANKLNFDLRMPSKDDEIQVGYVEFNGAEIGSFKAIGTTRSWNYHKGCRLQWLDDEQVIFNKVDNKDRLKSQIINIHTLTQRTIDYPIDSVSSDGKWATSFSYERLQKYMPGYGYAFSDRDSFQDQKAPQESGFYLIDLEKNERELIVSLKALYQKSRDKEMAEEGHHYVTHSLFSPDGNYASFMHRWVGQDTNKRYSQLVIYHTKEKTYKILPTGLMISHYDWNEKNEIIAYCNFEGVDCHALLNVEDFSKSKKVAYPQLNSDGHQSFIDNHSFITDTYPDKYRMAKLYQVNIPQNKARLIASVYSPKKFQTITFEKHIACDLHPTVSQDGKYLCFDTAKSGKRALAVTLLK